MGGKIGLGKEDGGFFDVIFVKIRDVVNSLDPLPGSIPGPDITLNNSTHGDLALTTSLGLTLGSVNVMSSYKYIGPGYESLALGSQSNDSRELSITPSATVGKVSVSGNFGRMSDNLRQQKIKTTVRTLFGGNLSVQPLSSLSSNFNGTYMKMSDGGGAEVGAVNFTTLSLSTSQSLHFDEKAVLQLLSFNYAFQSSGDGSPLSQNPKSDTHSATLMATLVPRAAVILTPNAGITSTAVGAIRTNTTNLSIQAQHRAMDGKLNLGASTGVTLSAMATKSYQNSFSANYDITPQDHIAFSATPTMYRSGTSGSPNFNEFRESLTLSHRF